MLASRMLERGASGPMLMMLLAGWLPAISASPFVISDYRIRDPNLTPALGRGYSLTTYDVLSTCLGYEERTEPTYNYDYEMMEFNSDGQATSDVSAGFSGSLSWGFIRATVSGNMKSTQSSSYKKHHVVVKMSMERYYSSIADTTASLTPDAYSLVSNGDLVGFFQSCGSGYIRSIRRTAEFTGVFEFESSSKSSASEMAAHLRIKVMGRTIGKGDASFNENKTSSSSKMTIHLKAFGLGLNQDGADSLVSHSFEDFNKAVKYAFQSMQNDQVGMIHGIEVVPWVDNLQFNNAVSFTDQEQINYNPSTGVQELKTMQVALKDDTGAVVKDDQGNDMMEEKPIVISAIEVKTITTINAEFINALSSFHRKQMYTITLMFSCQGALRMLSLNPKVRNRYLLDHTRMHMNPEDVKTESLTAAQAANYLTPAIVVARLNSAKTFVSHFYGPCATAISRHSNAGRMTVYWWDLPECTPSGDGALPEDTSFCLKAGQHFEVTDDTVKCKHQDNVAVDTKQFAYGIDMFLDKFCMPEVDPSITEPGPDVPAAPSQPNPPPNPPPNPEPNPRPSAQANAEA